jgi:hypothetical protein
LASAVPFLRLIVAHLEWPDIGDSPGKTRFGAEGVRVSKREDYTIPSTKGTKGNLKYTKVFKQKNFVLFVEELGGILPRLAKRKCWGER